MAYHAWGAESRQIPLLCVHGLTRNGRDFDVLAKTLSPKHPVICPDIVGRGESDWLQNPQHYTYPQYAKDMLSLLSCLHTKQVNWLGTSMGGLIGMMLASDPKTPMRKLIINDIGPFISQNQINNIIDYLKVSPTFSNLKQAQSFMQNTYKGFGKLSEADWQKLTQTSFAQNENGQYVRTYDPAIIQSLRPVDVDLWAVWAKIQCPILLIYGSESQFVTADLVDAMAKSKPSMQIHCVHGAGHAPALMDRKTIEIISGFLD